jgi:hypothetical protein
MNSSARTACNASEALARKFAGEQPEAMMQCKILQGVKRKPAGSGHAKGQNTDKFFHWVNHLGFIQLIQPVQLIQAVLLDQDTQGLARDPGAPKRKKKLGSD